MLSSCEKDFESYPIGYGLIDSNHVAKAKLRYISKIPYNVNELSLDVYYLPSLWAEVEYNDLENNNIKSYTSISGLVTKYYARYILIGELFFTAVIQPPGNSYNVSYIDEHNNNLLTLLEDEEFAKFYIESIIDLDFHITDINKTPINLTYVLDVDTKKTNFIHKENSMILINYADTLSTLPDFSSQFRGKGYDSTLINQVFERAYQKATLKEFRTTVY
jgi:hypothetical protein